MGYSVTFIGLVNFFNEGRLVLLPDGRTPGEGIPPHRASFLIETARVDFAASDWWAPTNDLDIGNIGVSELPILEPSRIVISGQEDPQGESSAGEASDPKEEAGVSSTSDPLDDDLSSASDPLDDDLSSESDPLDDDLSSESDPEKTGEVSAAAGEEQLDTSGHSAFIPRLKEIDPEFTIVPEKAATIAQMPLRRGKLEAFVVQDSVLSQLTVTSHAGPVTITATVDQTGEVRKLLLLEGTEIILANMSNPFAAHAEDRSHFTIYAQLDVNRKADVLAAKDPDISNALTLTPSEHPFIVKLLEDPGFVPRPGCSNTGCCAGTLRARTTTAV
jgi:hypothetical protein